VAAGGTSEGGGCTKLLPKKNWISLVTILAATSSSSPHRITGLADGPVGGCTRGGERAGASAVLGRGRVYVPGVEGGLLVKEVGEEVARAGVPHAEVAFLGDRGGLPDTRRREARQREEEAAPRREGERRHVGLGQVVPHRPPLSAIHESHALSVGHGSQTPVRAKLDHVRTLPGWIWGHPQVG
jgi:hypothetical protein